MILEAVSIVMLFSYNSYQASVWISSANLVTGKIYEWKANVTHFFSLSERNEQLTLRNTELEQQIDKLRQHVCDLTSDTSYAQRIELENLKQFELIPAKVVSNSINNADNLIVFSGFTPAITFTVCVHTSYI